MDPFTMSLDDVRAEAERRRQRRERGKPLTPELPEPDHAELNRVAEQDHRLEKEIQSDVRRKYMAFGCEVYSTSQARASKVSAGIPDLIVFHPASMRAWLHEVKAPRGVVSPAQLVFWELATMCNWKYLLGGVAAAEAQLIHVGAAYRDPSGSLEPARIGGVAE